MEQGSSNQDAQKTAIWLPWKVEHAVELSGTILARLPHPCGRRS